MIDRGACQVGINTRVRLSVAGVHRRPALFPEREFKFFVGTLHTQKLPHVQVGAGIIRLVVRLLLN
jgi:hypothetical protein